MIDETYIKSLLESGSETLFAQADAARRQYCGDAVQVRGIIEFSNICSCNCTYCGLRKDNKTLSRYAMTLDEILVVVEKAEKEGLRTIVLQGGENHAMQSDWLAEVIGRIKQKFDMAVTLCVGVQTPETYQIWREAGADRYLLKHETANASFYEEFHPDDYCLDQRIAALRILKSLGYQIGNGCIVGLPGQTVADLVGDIALSWALDVDMASFGPFVSHPKTPLANAPNGLLDRALRTLAAARLALGPVHIPATSAFDAIALDGREQALRCGANVIMANLTPSHYRDLYDLYPRTDVVDSIRRVKEIVASAGRTLAEGCGHSLKRTRRVESCSAPLKV